MIDHIGVQVADVQASLALFLRTFAPIGMRELMRFPQGDSVVVGLAGPDNIPNFWLSPAAGAETRELHLAFRAADRAAVDAVHDAAVWREPGQQRQPVRRGRSSYDSPRGVASAARSPAAAAIRRSPSRCRA